TVFDFDRDGDTVYMTMEFLEGESLDKFVKRHLLRGVAIDKAIEIVRSLGDGLAYAHAKSVVHSDFKPANAFLTASGVVKIFDFGIARAAKQPTDLEGEKTLFDAGELGALTPAYASCEMIEGGDPDPRDDVYALALVAYELMTGRHPFDKKSAVMARDSNMSAEPVKGLSRRQWRGIQRGLAFNREDRSASVEVFLDELNPRKLPVPIIAAAAVVIVAVSALLFIGLPGYLDDREVESLITDINDGPDETITARLMDLKNIQEQDASLFRDVFASPGIQQRFIEYYRRRIAAVWNPPDERFDFPRAEQLLAELQVFFSDSRAVSDLQGEIQEQRGEKIAELYTEVTSLLTAGVLIGEQADRNVLTVLGTLKQISPEDQRLSGEDIPIRFAEVATAQLQDGQLTLAERIVDQGLAFLPDDIGMLNVKDAINNQRDQVARAGRIGEFESILAQTGSSADAMTSPAVRDAFIGLSGLDPGNRVVAETRQRIERSILSDLQGIQQQGNYADGYRLLQKVEGLASAQFLAAQTAELDAVAEQYLARIDTLFSELQIAVDSDRLDSGTGSATSILEQLDSLGVPTDRLIDARTQISAGYSRRAVRAQQSEQWDLARQHLRTGLAMDLPPSVRTRLEKELGDVDSY
ncbi:MAG: protein kinase, partial [Pseudomonadales bacterium]